MVQPVNLFDYEALAQKHMPPPCWDFYQGGSDDELTLRANRSGFEQLRLHPRVLVDVSTRDLRTSVQGIPVSMPILIAPTAAHGLAHADAECATARAAGEAGTLMVASTESTRSLEEIAHAAQEAGGPLWFQLYIDTFEDAQSLVKRAEVAGYRTIVLTVDTPRLSRRERDIRHGFRNFQLSNYPHAFKGNAQDMGHGSMVEPSRYIGDTLTWDVLPWLHGLTSLPILIKGILTSEDATLAVQHGANGIIVSNHGGRQLDGVPASIEALSEVVEAVAGRCEVYLDGGIRRGTDVLKALAMGARAVLIGRPVLWGLAVNGQTGVHNVLAMLRAELELAMALSGCPTVKSITREMVQL